MTTELHLFSIGHEVGEAENGAEPITTSVFLVGGEELWDEAGNA